MRRSRSKDPKAPSPVTGCEHLLAVAVAVAVAVADAEKPEPPSPQCQECAEDGDSTWAHLRMCLVCGHVGCCDSSPRQHATAHFRDSGHPVMRSIEPGESWRWCYIDLELLG